LGDRFSWYHIVQSLPWKVEGERRGGKGEEEKGGRTKTFKLLQEKVSLSFSFLPFFLAPSPFY